MTALHKPYDLEERSYQFARNVSGYIKNLPKNIQNYEYSKQLIRSSGSVGANYLEANESLGKRDFLMRLRISKKEAKESWYWLRLSVPEEQSRDIRDQLMQEATELMKILGAIIEKSK